MLFDSFINPNIAYLLLVGGVMLGIMATLAPGTGVLEAGALVVLVLAGWQMYQLPVNWWALAMLVLGVFPFILAVRHSGKLVYLGLSLTALVVGSAFLFQGEGWLPAVNPVLALIVSTLSAGFIWLVTVKTLEAADIAPSHDLSDIVGAVGVTKSKVHEEGSVMVQREEWSAYSLTPIQVGVRVRVIAREGFLLQVEPVAAES